MVVNPDRLLPFVRMSDYVVGSRNSAEDLLIAVQAKESSAVPTRCLDPHDVRRDLTNNLIPVHRLTFRPLWYACR